MPDSYNGGPAIDFLLKEVSYSTCDNKFFGELEKEMLIPNNINIHGKIQGAKSLRNYQLRIDLPQETVIGYIKKPVSSNNQGERRILTYNLEDLINFEDYWWFQLQGETEFHLALNLLPPFPRLNPVDLQISCQPDILSTQLLMLFKSTPADLPCAVTITDEAGKEIPILRTTRSTILQANAQIMYSPYSMRPEEITRPRQAVIQAPAQ